MNRQLNAFFKRYQALPADRQQYVLPRFVGLLQGRYGKSNASWLERVSVIGKQLERIVNAYVSKLSVGYANPLEDIVASEVRLIIAGLLSKEFRPQIVESLRKQLADQITDEFISKLLLKALER